MAITFNTLGRAQIGVSLEDIEAARAALEGIRNGFVRAYARALNTASDGVRTDMVAMARDSYTFRADAVRARIQINRATWANLTASVVSRGPAVHLTEFLGTRQISTGLSVDIKRSTGRQYITHAFLNTARSGRLLALRRRVIDGRRVGRYPVEALYGPHPEVVYNTPENWDTLEDQADERLAAAFANEVDGVLRQYA